MTTNRRAQRKASALFANAESAFTRAADLLISGEALPAMRLARVTEQLLRLHSHISCRREAEARRRRDETKHTLDAARRELADREGALAVREWRLSQEAERIESLRQELEALYAKLYAARADDTQTPCD